jgi:anaerobic magnesium-protoporphyrin IX monomethyl ester cyclase
MDKRETQMKVLLLNPPAKRIAEKKDVPRYQHIGLGYLASSIEKAGYQVKVIDAKLERLGVKEAVREIEKYSPDILGVTAMTHEIETAMLIARDYKRIDPGVKIVLGGVHVTALPEETLERYPQVDIGIIGEGEFSFPLIIEAVEKGERDLSFIPGVAFRDEKGGTKRTEMERIHDLDSLPRPGWKHFKNARDYMIVTARGCPYSCVFCMQASGRIVRKRSPENVVREIEEVIAERAPEKFLFFDETFTLDKQRVHAICDMLIEKGLDKRMKWSVTTRADAVDRPLLEKMKKAGCYDVGFGVESGNNESLKLLKKGITKEQARESMAISKELEFYTEVGFILGNPEETLETALETIDFAVELNPDLVLLGIMVPYPGTEVREMALKHEGGYRLLSEDWSEYNKQLGNALELDNLSRSDLERLQLLGYLKVFIYNGRYLDFIKFIFSFRREMFAYLRNILRKRERTRKPRISYLQVLRLIFKKPVVN